MFFPTPSWRCRNLLVKIKSVEEIAKKWADVTPARAPYYEAEVKTAGPEWKTKAAAGQAAYKQAMTDPKVLDRRLAGITDATATKFQTKAGTVGPGRFREGIAAGTPYYTEGFGPYQGVIAAWVPPARGPRGDPKNYEIVKSIGDALHKKRVGA
jgi:hypothetical protein